MSAAVAGVTLRDGRAVVVKALPPDHSRDRLDRTLLARRCPERPGCQHHDRVAGGLASGSDRGTLQEALCAAAGDRIRAPHVRTTAATSWAALTDVLAETIPTTGWVALPRVLNGLYPRPHSPLFDFDATTIGAEWIDDLARRARDVMSLADSAPTIVHTDWRPRQPACGDQRQHGSPAIYDWDSLQLEIEPVALGIVAAMHTVDFTADGGPHFPTATEAVAFAADAGAARRQSFTNDEWNAVQASIVYGWCYTARCEHARAAIGDDRPSFGARSRLTTDSSQDLLTNASNNPSR